MLAFTCIHDAVEHLCPSAESAVSVDPRVYLTRNYSFDIDRSSSAISTNFEKFRRANIGAKSSCGGFRTQHGKKWDTPLFVENHGIYTVW